MILEEHKRPDGRKIDEIRPLSCEVGVLQEYMVVQYLQEDKLK